MAAMPSSENNISEVAGITGVTRDEAILLLQKNNSDASRAINAFFDDPIKALEQEQPGGISSWNDQPYQNSDLPTYDIDATDTSNLTAPSRPPSRLSTTNNANLIDLSAEHAAAHPDQSMPYSQRQQTDDRFNAEDIARATAASLQESGVQQKNGAPTTGQNFGPANRDYYPNQDWGLVHVSNATTHEVIVHPEPEDRKRELDTPAFLRSSEQSEYLSALLTILHAIPLSREALLMTSVTLPDYGHDPQWWSGSQIHVPKVVSLDHSDPDDGFEEVLHESQRLMAFLDSTTRAYGSSDQLGNLPFVQESLEPTMISKFFDCWSRAAIGRNPSNMLATVFTSSALKMPLEDMEEPVRKDFTCLDASVETQHGQSLYDVLDRTIWADQIDAELDDVWIQDVAEVFTIRILTHDKEGGGLGVKIPAVWYPDRYLDACKEISIQLRIDKMDAEKERKKIDLLMEKYRTFQPPTGPALNIEEVLKAAGASAETVVKDRLSNGVPDSMGHMATDRPRVSTTEAQNCVEELKALAARLEQKMRILEGRKQKATEHLNQISRQLTEQTSPTEPPFKKYTLRGVSTSPHITYVLRKAETQEPGSHSQPKWQWWRISFSIEDGKLQSDAKPEVPEEPTEIVSWGYPKAAVSDWSRKLKKHRKRDGDVAGYTIRKVTQVEVLKAARDENKPALLVYANENAAFVELDNKFFEAELADEDPSNVMAESQDFSNTESGWPESEQMIETVDPSKFASNNPFRNVKSYDESIPTALLPQHSAVDDPFESSETQGYDHGSSQEMQERGGVGLLGSNRQGRVGQPPQSMDRIGEEMDEDDTGDATRSGYA